MVWQAWANGNREAVDVIAHHWQEFFDDPRSQTVCFTPSTWRCWLTEGAKWLPGERLQPAFDTQSISRRELADLSSAASDQDSCLELFVATMIWGMGRRNGRMFPRVVGAIDRLRSKPDFLPETAGQVRDGQLVAAHQRLAAERLGIREPFFTKWMYVAGLCTTNRPRALVLDGNVWASLGALGWSSGEREPARRYDSYVRQAEDWAAALRSRGNGDATAEGVEMELFQLGAGLGRSCRALSHKPCDSCATPTID